MAQGHFVFTYQQTGPLVDRVAAWIAPTLAAGGGALLVCRGEHARLVRAKLAETLDVPALEARGLLRVEDARGTLSRFMQEGAPNGRAFKRIARGLLAQLRAAGAKGTVRAWGEMVDILAREGNPEAAHRLERLWNEILVEEPAELLCSYELDRLDAQTHARVLLDVCATHSHLAPEEGAALDDAVHRALGDAFGPAEGEMLSRILPTRRHLLLRMSSGSAILASLRGLDPVVGERVHGLARKRLREGLTASASSAPR